MTESTRMWMEIPFNLLYLLVVWWLVAVMARRLEVLDAVRRPVGRLFLWSFALLGFGDFFHLGFRLWAYAAGQNLDAQVSVMSWRLGPVGMGALATATTVTVFYVLMLFIWRARFQRPFGWFGSLLLLAAAARFFLMAFPANEWNNAVPPQPWSLYRNLPLMVQGLGVAYLILRDARQNADRTFLWVGICILASFAFYMPVIFFVQQAPLVGMLMIPKTVAYVAAGFVAFKGIFQVEQGMAPQTA